MFGLQKAHTLILALVLAAASMAVFAQNKVVVIPIVDEGVNATSIWLPAADAVVSYGDRNQALAQIETAGQNCIVQDEPGLVVVGVYFPIQISVPVGRSSRITGATIYYEAPVDTSFILGTTIRGRDFETGRDHILVQDANRHDSTSFDSYTIAVTDNENVTSLMAPTSVEVRLGMTSEDERSRVCFYGVSLELG
jgi:hypothetical protein